MPKKHLTSKVLYWHIHACASAQSFQGLWVFTVEMDLHELRDCVQENIRPTRLQISMWYKACSEVLKWSLRVELGVMNQTDHLEVEYKV